MSKNKYSLKEVVLVLGVLILLGSASIKAVFQHTTIEYYKVTITDKERISVGSGEDISHKYLVFADENVFENTDSIFHWKWDSSTVQSKLEKGKQYSIKTYGWRVPFLSWYENIVSVKAI